EPRIVGYVIGDPSAHLEKRRRLLGPVLKAMAAFVVRSKTCCVSGDQHFLTLASDESQLSREHEHELFAPRVEMPLARPSPWGKSHPIHSKLTEPSSIPKANTFP